MFVRNGEALGSVHHDTAPSAEAPKRSHHKKEPEEVVELGDGKVEEKSAPEPKPEPEVDDVIDISKLTGKAKKDAGA